ncbi:MAG: formylglycine-generating enzyme family protein, partial [Anaerolineales bacterium]|nr:formylglycine-generating enzyme family protein [Anaerolineales bacterium]
MKRAWNVFRYTFTGLRGQISGWGLSFGLYGLILLVLLLTSCGSTKTPVPAATQVAEEESAYETMTANAPTVTPRPTNTSAPAETSTASAIPSSTPTLELIGVEDQTPITRSQDGMVMVYVQAGDFLMGNPLGVGSDEEAPQHIVTLNGFWVDSTEVTNAQYRLFVDATGHPAPINCDWGDPTYGDAAYADHPVVCVNWDDANAYCEWAGARLPTEAEWEKAARGTDGQMYPWGTVFDGTLVNFCDARCDNERVNDCGDTRCYSVPKDPTVNDSYVHTAPVGSFLAGASPYGALDMAGNVWEWVADWYDADYYAA